ncbi:MAG: NAD(P)-binding domain-containing protein [Yaniella sp.]|nr:NAD(P)-binding domain-containing protein [Yaniella sp.]
MPDTTCCNSQPGEELPVIILGAGPVGLAAAAHLIERGITPLVLEAGPSVGASIAQWGHTKLFSPWRYNIDDAARRLLERAAWTAPDPDVLPTGNELIQQYLEPLAAALGDTVRTGMRVTAVSREGIDKTRSYGREDTPYIVRVVHPGGNFEDLRARSVIDASGTWNQPNPLGQAGLPAPGEADARARGFISAPLPDVGGVDRERFAGRHVFVVGSGHSAANSLLDLAELAHRAPGTRISWAVRGVDVTAVYGGEDGDELAARGSLGSRLRALVEDGRISVHTSFVINSFDISNDALVVHADSSVEPRQLSVDVLVPATGFRPDLNVLSELRLEMDPAVEAPRALGPLIDPEFHSCGSVEPHGERILAHPETGFYIVGMKSYGRAPTFLMATGYEQVRSIAASLAGDREAADDLKLQLPTTGVCTTDPGSAATNTGSAASTEHGCCAPVVKQPILIGAPESACC